MAKLVNIGFLVVAVLVVAYFAFLRGGDVSGTEARRLVQAGGRLVDVRTPGEFASGHIDGAVNIPLQELEQRLGELKPLDSPIVLYCRSGNRSGRASRLLKGAGYSAVHDLGSISRW